MTTFYRTCLGMLAVTLSLVSAIYGDADTHEKFFRSVAPGKADPRTKVRTTALKVEVEEPMLSEWMRAISERLGKVQEIEIASLETTVTDDQVDD